MAKRPTINTLTNTASPTYLTQLNQNFSNIQAQFDNTLSLDGSLPNAMNADLDLNDFDLINAGTVNADNLVVAGTNLNSVVAQAATSATNAATSASSAAASAATASQYTPAYFDNVTDLLADTRAWPTGQILNTREEGFAYEVAASSATNQHVTTAGGVKLYVQPPYDVKAFGAIGDGISDDRTVLQRAVTAARLQGGQSRKLYWSKGTYLVTGQITLGTNQYIDFDPGVVINLLPPSSVDTTSLFVAANQSNVHLNGNGATINGSRAAPSSTGTAAAFFIFGTDNVSICDFNINDFSVDGITITGDDAGSGASRNVFVKGCVVNNCCRNGMSIVSAIGCVVLGGEYNGTNGSPLGPFAGIDIEPEPNSFLEDVNIIGVTTIGNDGAGIQITPGALSANVGKRFYVNIIGGRSLSDGDLVLRSALRFSNGGAQVNKVFGHVNVSGFAVDNPKSSGVRFTNWDEDKCPMVSLESVTVRNPDSTSSASTNLARSGFVLFSETAQATSNIGNITMRNCRAEDSRTPARMVWGCAVGADAGKTAKNIDIYDFAAINFTSGSKTDVHTLGNTEDVSVSFPSSNKVDVSVDTNLANFGGKVVNVTTSSRVMTLPLAGSCSGLTYHIQTAPGVASVSVNLQAGDTIQGLVGVAGVGVVLDAGGSVSLKSQGGTSWIVEKRDGSIRRAGTSVVRQIWWATAAPVSGTWVQGDRVFNQLPAIGQPKSWVCTVAGTPGTWVSEGNL
jgi:hypothetical protein